MAITKETEIARIEVVGPFRALNVRTDTVIKEDGTEISRKSHRRVLDSDMDISAEDAEVKAVANAVWTDTIKAAWEKHKTDNP
jgi:hypothetical protein|tara:strand:- start:5 stop:253 length:249 start_codon:yes stop_codon:yes gene_type:complete